MSVSTFLLGLVLPAAEELEKETLDPVLDDLFASNLDDYKATVTGLHAAFNHIDPFLAKSKSNIIKGLVGALEDELNANATKHAIVL